MGSSLKYNFNAPATAWVSGNIPKSHVNSEKENDTTLTYDSKVTQKSWGINVHVYFKIGTHAIR